MKITVKDKKVIISCLICTYRFEIEEQAGIFVKRGDVEDRNLSLDRPGGKPGFMERIL